MKSFSALGLKFYHVYDNGFHSRCFSTGNLDKFYLIYFDLEGKIEVYMADKINIVFSKQKKIWKRLLYFKFECLESNSSIRYIFFQIYKDIKFVKIENYNSFEEANFKLKQIKIIS